MPSVRFQNRRKSVCIIIPVRNDLETLPDLRTVLADVETQLRGRYDTHYIVVDDGSTDGSGAFLSLLAPEGRPICVLTHRVTRGIGAALRTGFRQADAQIVCTVAADDVYPMDGLVSMIAEVDRGLADVVVASPYHPDGEVKRIPAGRLFFSRQCARLYRLYVPLALSTYTSTFRAYRGSFIREATFVCNGFESAMELLFCAERLGYRISEAPMTLSCSPAGTSKLASLPTVWKHLRFLAAYLGERYALPLRAHAAKEPHRRRDVPPLVRGLANQLPQDVQR